ncbi:hypothetical protein HNV11_23675 (plasmid) [Spirosoma taeanense]|uniref:Uncharacterized protein n=1 Tax=Spirosoma taeanense TaxID=2735870 RepID=A0A6M5YFR0_9BACT|nr:hypothetical protein [Spirosoma taeanense]QJW92474.1 hypothetical protein HNV11_23675 [Spirosoma taeanense]
MEEAKSYSQELPIGFKMWTEFYNRLIELDQINNEIIDYNGVFFKKSFISDRVDEEHKYSQELPPGYESWTDFYQSLEEGGKIETDDVIYERNMRVGGGRQLFGTEDVSAQYTYRKQFLIDMVNKEKKLNYNSMSQNKNTLISVAEGDYRIVVSLTSDGYEAQAFRNNQPATAKYSLSFPVAVNVKAYTDKSFTHLVDQLRADIREGRVI